MKTINLLLTLLLLLSIKSFGQNPCDWAPMPSDQDSVDWAKVRYEGTIYRIPESKAPNIDGIMDKVWYCSSTPLELQSREGLNPDPNMTADVRFLYDSTWLYLAVNVLHDDEVYQAGVTENDVDRIELMFQNTWGGRRDGTYDHCNESKWWAWYWEQDGDKKMVIPSTKELNGAWLDNDINDECVLPHSCSETLYPGWLTMGVMRQMLYEVDTTELSDGNYRITYELAFHFSNFLGFDENTPVKEGHSMAFEVSVRDVDDGVLNGHFNMSYPNNIAWYSPLAASKMTLGPVLELTDTCAPPIDLCATDPSLCATYKNDFKYNEEISIYPNPTNNMLNIVSPIEISVLEISNMSGQKIYKGSNIGKEVNISQLENGVYFISIYSEGNLVSVQRLVKH